MNTLNVIREPDGFVIEVARESACDPEKAYAAFSTADGWNAWFSHSTIMDLRAGGGYRNGDGDAGKFLAINPGESVRFTWDQKMHRSGSEVWIRVEPTSTGCRIVLRHEKLQSEEDARDLSNGGWDWAMDSLKSYLSTGRGIKYDDWKTLRS